MSRWNSSVLLSCLLCGVAAPAHAAILTHPRAPRISNISLRKRLNVNTLITEPGTVEAEWDSLYSFTSGNFSTPSTIKYTPMGKSILWGRTEFSAAFNAVDSVPLNGQRITQFSDRVTVAANSVLSVGGARVGRTGQNKISAAPQGQPRRPAQVRTPRRVLQHAEDVLDSFVLMDVTPSILKRAAMLDPPDLRTLDAIHVATALSLDLADLDFIAYDARLSRSARAHGLRTAAPGA